MQQGLSYLSTLVDGFRVQSRGDHGWPPLACGILSSSSDIEGCRAVDHHNQFSSFRACQFDHCHCKAQCNKDRGNHFTSCQEKQKIQYNMDHHNQFRWLNMTTACEGPNATTSFIIVLLKSHFRHVKKTTVSERPNAKSSTTKEGILLH